MRFGSSWAGVGAGLAFIMATQPASAGEGAKPGGTLTYMIAADAPPSFDAHRENTFATIHTAAPFYSVLIRINSDDPSSTTDFVCDLCTELPQPSDEGRTYTFKIREGVKFHDGSPLTAFDVMASWNKLIFPPEGVTSARQSHYMMVDRVEAPDPSTVVFRLNFATAAFLPALTDPFNWIYKKEILDRDPHWYEKNILGSGPSSWLGSKPVNRSGGAAIQITIIAAGPISTASLGSMRRNRPRASTRSAATAPRSIFAICRRSRATNWSQRWGTRSLFRRRTSTAAI